VYSCGQNFTQLLASGGAISVRTITPNGRHPDRPCRDAKPAAHQLWSALARHRVAVDASSPRRLRPGMTAHDDVVEPPYCRAVIDTGQHHDRVGGVSRRIGSRIRCRRAGLFRKDPDQRADDASDTRLPQHGGWIAPRSRPRASAFFPLSLLSCDDESSASPVCVGRPRTVEAIEDVRQVPSPGCRPRVAHWRHARAHDNLDRSRRKRKKGNPKKKKSRC